MNGTTVSTSLLPARSWWQTRYVRSSIVCRCGFSFELQANVKLARNGVPAMKCPACKTALNILAVETLAAVVAAGFKRTAEKN